MVMARHSKNEGKKDRKHGGVLTEIEKGKLYGIDMTVDGQRIRERFRGNKTEAVEHMESLRTSAKTGVRVEKRGVTYAVFSDSYFHDLERSGTVRPSTIKQYRTIEAHITRSRIGKKRLASITSSDVNSLFAEMRENGVGETTVYQAYAQLKRIFAAAIADRIIQFTPINRNVHKPIQPEPDRHALSKNEADRLRSILPQCEPDACSLATLIALSTGLRIGEILGLTIGNTFIGCSKPHFNVIQQRTKERCIAERKTSKNGRAPNPWVPIDPQLEQVLFAWETYQTDYFARKLGIQVTTDTPLCSNSVGSWSDTHNIEKQFRAFCVENGFGEWVDDEGRTIVRTVLGNDSFIAPDNTVIEYYDHQGWPVDEDGRRYSRTYPKPKIKRHYRGLKFHELRKTNFTLRLDRGESIKTLQAHGGWFSPRMLLENYGEAVEESVRTAPNFLEYLQSI